MQPHDRRQYPFPRQPAAPQIDIDLGADARQHPTEQQHSAELGLVARLAPAGVIAVLLAPARIAADRLDVAVRTGRSTPPATPAGSPAP